MIAKWDDTKGRFLRFALWFVNIDHVIKLLERLSQGRIRINLMRKTSSPGREATLTLWTGYGEDVNINIDVKLSWFVCSIEYIYYRARKSLVLTKVSSVNECGKWLKVMLVLLRTVPLMWSSHDRHIMVGHIWLDSTLIKSLFLMV